MDYPGDVYQYSKHSRVTKEYATNVIIAGIMNSLGAGKKKVSLFLDGQLPEETRSIWTILI